MSESWHSKKSIQDRLLAFHEAKACFPHEAVSVAQETHETVMRDIRGILQEKGVALRFEYFGSSYEDLKVGTTDVEFDVMVVLSGGQNLKEEVIRPGFARLRPVSNLEEFRRKIGPGGFLDPVKTMSRFYGDMTKALRRMPSLNDRVLLLHHGTAAQMDVYEDEGKEKFCYSVDMVLAYQPMSSGAGVEDGLYYVAKSSKSKKRRNGTTPKKKKKGNENMQASLLPGIVPKKKKKGSKGKKNKAAALEKAYLGSIPDSYGMCSGMSYTSDEIDETWLGQKKKKKKRRKYSSDEDKLMTSDGATYLPDKPSTHQQEQQLLLLQEKGVERGIGMKQKSAPPNQQNSGTTLGSGTVSFGVHHRREEKDNPVVSSRDIGAVYLPQIPPIPLKEKENSREMSWGMCFPLAEKEKLITIDEGNKCGRQCIRIIKVLQFTEPGLKDVKSYWLKTTLFNLRREEPSLDWNQTKLGERLFDMMRYLADSIEDATLYDYFLPDQNLFENLSQEKQSKLLSSLRDLMRNEDEFNRALDKAQKQPRK